MSMTQRLKKFTMLSKLKILILLSLFMLGCQRSIYHSAEHATSNKPLVVNGTEIDISIFPRTVALVTSKKGYIFCTGTIVSSDLIMTAAHCVSGMQGKQFYIIHNCQRLKGCNNIVAVKTFSIHHNYDQTKKHWNDIAVLLLNKQIFLDTDVTILHPSQYKNVLKENTDIAVVGYGRSSDRGAGGILRAGMTKVTKRYKKEIILGQDLPEQANVCFGDSGSSFYIFHKGTKYAAGIASRLLVQSSEQMCGGGSVYTLDGEYRNWILKEYTRMLTNTLPETNHMKVHSGCNISYTNHSGIHLYGYIVMCFMLFIRKLFNA